ncbi:hypothetical protein [Microbacterium sp. SA39]|uniref:hypothetical protein n=1 Tax=Microbacterium sp. SA39 TaxID=1263625 RepID=UPI0005F9B765|nr:hypothetical protein [Microbacterium sp. SA39]KJQ52828.1 hypothetical protein RS85_03722 [Microbacterium sp. SA39]
MNDAEAAIQAANITLWGAIIVGSLAMIGTIVSSVIAPILRARAEAKQSRENARTDALREIIPSLISLAIRNRFRASTSSEEVAELAAAVAKFEMWLTPEEALIGTIARRGLVLSHAVTSTKELNDKETAAFTSATGVLPRWVRGELSPDEAWKEFERDTTAAASKGQG